MDIQKLIILIIWMFQAAISVLRKRWFTENLSLNWAPLSEFRSFLTVLTNLSLPGYSMKSLPNLSYLNNLVTLGLYDMDVIPELQN